MRVFPANLASTAFPQPSSIELGNSPSRHAGTASFHCGFLPAGNRYGLPSATIQPKRISEIRVKDGLISNGVNIAGLSLASEFPTSFIDYCRKAACGRNG